MRPTTTEAPRPRLLWVREPNGETDLVSFAPPDGSVRIVRPEAAPAALAELSRDPERSSAVVVLESGVPGFDLLCARLSAMAPAPRVVILYPRLRVLQSSSRLPDLTQACR